MAEYLLQTKLKSGVISSQPACPEGVDLALKKMVSSAMARWQKRFEAVVLFISGGCQLL